MSASTRLLALLSAAPPEDLDALAAEIAELKSRLAGLEALQAVAALARSAAPPARAEPVKPPPLRRRRTAA